MRFLLGIFFVFIVRRDLCFVFCWLIVMKFFIGRLFWRWGSWVCWVLLLKDMVVLGFCLWFMGFWFESWSGWIVVIGW